MLDDSPARHSSRSRCRHRGTARSGGGRLALSVGAAALLAILSSQVGTTFALWSAATPLPGATITAGSIGLLVDGASESTVAALATTRLRPGSAIAAPVTVSNSGTAPVAVRSAAGVVTTGSSALAAKLTVRLVVVAAPAQCTTSTGGGVSSRITTLPAAPLATLNAGSAVTLCVVVSLDSDAPSTLQGTSVGFRLPLSGSQVAP